MRTTLDIDDDVLSAAKELAAREKTTAGKVISDLVRRELTRLDEIGIEYRNGIPLLPRAKTIITTEMVKKWREDE